MQQRKSFLVRNDDLHFAMPLEMSDSATDVLQGLRCFKYTWTRLKREFLYIKKRFYLLNSITFHGAIACRSSEENESILKKHYDGRGSLFREKLLSILFSLLHSGD